MLLCFRHQLNCKKNKVDNCTPRKPNAHLAQRLNAALSSPPNNEDFKDDSEKPLSKSLIGGNMNVRKTMVITLGHQERVVQGLLCRHKSYLLSCCIYMFLF